jgi:hypothetical protein
MITNKEQQMKLSQILKEAKKHIATTREEYGSNKDKFICMAVHWKCPGRARDKQRICNHISLLLNDGNKQDAKDGKIWAFERWLDIHHPKLNVWTNFNKVQKARLAWVDDMIKYWEAKGL